MRDRLTAAVVATLLLALGALPGNAQQPPVSTGELPLAGYGLVQWSGGTVSDLIVTAGTARLSRRRAVGDHAWRRMGELHPGCARRRKRPVRGAVSWRGHSLRTTAAGLVQRRSPASDGRRRGGW
ncbi:MAG: hypothetical protein AB7I38_13495 [Dehalococcoidia bacterium]